MINDEFFLMEARYKATPTAHSTMVSRKIVKLACGCSLMKEKHLLWHGIFSTALLPVSSLRAPSEVEADLTLYQTMGSGCLAGFISNLVGCR